MNVELNSNGVNKKIKAHILSDDEMREIGFTDYGKDRWYFCRVVQKFKYGFNITFNVDIPKDGSDIRIDILDESFAQPYDYQIMLDRNPKFEPALKVKEKVEEWMDYLQEKGVLSGHEYGEYI